MLWGAFRDRPGALEIDFEKARFRRRRTGVERPSLVMPAIL